MMKGLFHRREGQGLVEMALALPVLLVLLLGLFDIGRGVYAYGAITNSAREGARLAIVNQDLPSIYQRAASQSVGVAVATCVRVLAPGLTTSDCATTNASKLCGTLNVGCIVSVEVRTSYVPITPLVGQLIGPITFISRTEMPIEFVCPTTLVPEWRTAAQCPKQP